MARRPVRWGHPNGDGGRGPGTHVDTLGKVAGEARPRPRSPPHCTRPLLPPEGQNHEQTRLDVRSSHRPASSPSLRLVEQPPTPTQMQAGVQGLGCGGPGAQGAALRGLGCGHAAHTHHGDIFRLWAFVHQTPY